MDGAVSACPHFLVGTRVRRWMSMDRLYAPQSGTGWESVEFHGLSDRAGTMLPVVATPAPIARHPQTVLVVLLVGMLALGTWTVRQGLTLTAPSTPPPPIETVEGVIVDFATSTRSPHLQLTLLDGQDLTLALNPNTTSVYKKGLALHVAHLRLGQLVKVTVLWQGGRWLARSIQIEKVPQELELGPAGPTG